MSKSKSPRAEAIKQALKVDDYLNKTRGGGYTIRGDNSCPNPEHADNDGSFSIFEGGLACKCHACGLGGDIISVHMGLDRVGFPQALEDLEQIAGAGTEPSIKKRVTHMYLYTDENGMELFRKRRWQPKRFDLGRIIDGKWRPGIKGVRRVLYGLPSVIGAPTIYLCEGEKDADCLNRLGLCATTSPTKEWTDSYTEALSGKNIVILPDNDKPGHKYAAHAAKELYGKTASLKMVALPGLGPLLKKGGKDIADWLNAGGTRDELEALVAAASEWDRRALTSPKNGTAGGRPVGQYEAAAMAFLAWYAPQGLVKHHGQWRRHDDEDGWLAVSQDVVEAKVVRFLQLEGDDYRLTPTSTHIVNVFKNLQPNCLIPPEVTSPARFDGERWHSLPGWVAFSDGIVNLDAYLEHGVVEREAYGPAVFAGSRRDFRFDPDAECPRFHECLIDWQPREEDRLALQAFVGLLQVPDTRYNVMAQLIGLPGSGKGTFTEAIRGTYGTENQCAIDFDKFGEKYVNFDLTQKLVNVIDETKDDSGRKSGHARETEHLIKRATSGGEMAVQRKHGQVVSLPITARTILLSNFVQKYHDPSGAILDRIRVWRFTRVFRFTDTDDVNLGDKLYDERAGIFAWGIRGLARLRRSGSGFPVTEATREVVEEMRFMSDTAGQFLQEAILGNGGGSVPKQWLFEQYKSWCDQAGVPGHVKCNQVDFNKAVRRCFPNVAEKSPTVNGKRVKSWAGIQRRSEIDSEPSTPESGKAVVPPVPAKNFLLGNLNNEEEREDEIGCMEKRRVAVPAVPASSSETRGNADDRIHEALISATESSTNGRTTYSLAASKIRPPLENARHRVEEYARAHSGDWDTSMPNVVGRARTLGNLR